MSRELATHGPPGNARAVFDDLATHELPGNARAVFTSRLHGNLSSVGGRDAEHGLRSRTRLREALGVRCLVRGYQVHGTVVGRIHDDPSLRRHDAPPAPAGDRESVRFDGRHASVRFDDDHTQPTFRADGHAIAAPSIAAMVLAADCLPVVLGAEGAVAALHAGWRGLAGGLLQEGVRALRDVGGRGDILAVIGPSAGPCCYEVGEDVHAVFHDSHRHGTHIDLRAIARDRLLAAGVSDVREVHACVICDERYFSRRREGLRAGRQAGVAWIEG